MAKRSKKKNSNIEENVNYGQSVLLRPSVEPEDKVYEKMEYECDEETVAELKENNSKVTTRIIKDAITGKQIGINVDEDDKLSETETVDSIINKRDVKGKSLSLSGKKMIEELLGYEPTEERINIIESKLKEIDDINLVLTGEIEEILGSEIIDTIKKKIFTSDNYMDVLKRFFEQLYENYIFNVQYNDDIRSLNELCRLLNELDLTDADPQNFEGKAKELENALAEIRRIEKGVKEQKMRYTIDDIQCNIIEEVRVDLLKALRLDAMYEVANRSGSKFKKDMKKLNKVKIKISTWISQLKSDENTIYSFPIIEDFGIVDMTNVADNFITFILNILLAQRTASVKVDDSELENYNTLEDYYMDKAKLTRQERQLYYEASASFAYLLCRTYKSKDIANNSDRRILSYVMDMISKANYRDYRLAMVNHVFKLHEILANS